MATTEKAGHRHNDAIEMLAADHKKVKSLFKKFASLKEDGGSEDEKAALVKQICGALTVHATIEEEIFYPAVRAAIDDADLMDEALVEHASAKELIAQLQEMASGEELFDAKVTVLGEQIDHHVKEEEGDMFPKVRKSKVDTQDLGAQMAERKEALLADVDTDLDDGNAAKKGSARSKKDAEVRRS
jgi:hemerythrin superfamily protein